MHGYYELFSIPDYERALVLFLQPGKKCVNLQPVFLESPLAAPTSGKLVSTLSLQFFLHNGVILISFCLLHLVKIFLGEPLKKGVSRLLDIALLRVCNCLTS